MSATAVFSFIQWLHYLALSLWIGGITFVSAVAAPAAHRSMASKAIAGQIVGDMLKRLNAVEMICAGLLLVTSFSSMRFIQYHRHLLWVMVFFIILMAMMTSFYAFSVTP